MAFADHVGRADDAVRAHLGSVAVIYAPTVGDPVTVTGMFDENYVLVDAGGQMGVELIAPAVWLDLAVMLGVSALVWPFLATKLELERWEGFVLLTLYGFYIFYLFV